MAMINCSECGSSISNTARVCPSCGAVPKTSRNAARKVGTAVWYALCAGVLVIIFGVFYAVGTGMHRIAGG